MEVAVVAGLLTEGNVEVKTGHLVVVIKNK
jgi:hypothetical protein